MLTCNISTVHIYRSSNANLLCFEQGSKKSKSSIEGLLQWDSEREGVLQNLIQLLQLDIRSLWSLSLVEEEFIRYFLADGALGKGHHHS